jgi:hypothetical protein
MWQGCVLWALVTPLRLWNYDLTHCFIYEEYNKILPNEQNVPQFQASAAALMRSVFL